MDGINFYDHLKKKLKFYDNIFLFEPTDINTVKNIVNHNNVFLLNLAYAPKRFFNNNTLDKKYDFSFVGSFYKNREIIISKILEYNKKGIIIGDFNKSNNKEITNINPLKQISVEETNNLYNNTLININAHHIQSIEGLNVRTYEIMGTGGVQMVENKKIAKEYFKDGIHCIFYSCEDEFIAKFNYYLKNKDLLIKIENNAYLVASSNHTWELRIQEMFQKINL
jgi:spore maturation protein CgeB